MIEHKCEMDPRERNKHRDYILIINEDRYVTLCQSIHEALRKAGELRLAETDVITVKLDD